MPKRWHEIMGELFGWLAGKCLHRLAHHALWINDELTFQRVRAVLSTGVYAGWDDDNPTRHVRANRGRNVRFLEYDFNRVDRLNDSLDAFREKNG